MLFRSRAVRSTAVAVGLAMAIPLTALLVNSFRVGSQWTFAAWSGLGHTEVRPGVSLGTEPLQAIATSLRSCVVATIISLVVGVATSLVVRLSRRVGRVLDVGITLPLGTSAVTIGLGLLITFDHSPFNWRGQWWMVPVGHALIATPFVVRTLLPEIGRAHV